MSQEVALVAPFRFGQMGRFQESVVFLRMEAVAMVTILLVHNQDRGAQLLTFTLGFLVVDVLLMSIQVVFQERCGVLLPATGMLIDSGLFALEEELVLVDELLFFTIHQVIKGPFRLLVVEAVLSLEDQELSFFET